MIHDMIYGSDMAYDKVTWHDMSNITYQTSTDRSRLALCVCGPNNSVSWHYVMMYMWLQFVLRPIDFPNRLLIFRRRWMKQNSMARRLDLEDRFFVFNNYVIYLLNILFKYCLINCVTSDMWVSRQHWQDFSQYSFWNFNIVSI